MAKKEQRSTPAENIRSIEIITNPGSEYAANTGGGIININLIRMFDEGFSGTLANSDEINKYNTSMLNGAINYRKGKVGVKVSPFLNNSFNYNTSYNTLVENSKTSQNIDKTFHRRYLVLGGGLGVDYDLDDRNFFSFNGFASWVKGTSDQRSLTRYLSSAGGQIDSPYSSPIAGRELSV